MSTLQKLVTGLLIVIALSACSSSAVYNRLDWLIPWYVDNYVDLSRDQKKTLRDQLAPLLQWHRQEELARYLQILAQIEAELAEPVTTPQVEAWFEEIVQATERIEQTMLPLALDFGDKLSEEQMSEFIDSLYEKQDEYEQEFLVRSDDEYVQDNAESLEDMLGRFLGKLNRQQKQRLQLGASEMRRFDATWLSDRRQWLDQLVPLLNRQDGWHEQFMQAYRDRQQNRPAEYTAIVNHNIHVIAAAVADVFNSCTSKQKEHTARELEDLRALLEKLIDEDKRD